jgi:hypothetical protein
MQHPERAYIITFFVTAVLSFIGAMAGELIFYMEVYGVSLLEKDFELTTCILVLWYFISAVMAYPRKNWLAPLQILLASLVFILMVGFVGFALFPISFGSLAMAISKLVMVVYNYFLILVSTIAAVIVKLAIREVHSSGSSPEEDDKESLLERILKWRWCKAVGTGLLISVVGGIIVLKISWNTMETNRLYHKLKDTYLNEARYYGYVVDIDKDGVDLKKDVIPYVADASFDQLSLEEQQKVMARLKSYDSDSGGLFSGHQFDEVTLRTAKGVYVYTVDSLTLVTQDGKK